MSGSTIGNLFKLTTFGESHGPCIGGVIEGCPAGFFLNFEEIELELQHRKPSGFFETLRREEDRPVFLSGIFEGKTTGHPIAFMVPNTQAHSADYELLKDVFRPSHADFTYEKKYGIRDYKGGGRASARETVARVVAGAIAKQILKSKHIEIYGYVSQIGKIKLQRFYQEFTVKEIESSKYRFPSPKQEEEIETLLKACKTVGDTVGGVVNCILKGVPIGLGEPVFDKLHAQLAKAMLSIHAARGFDIGEGFAAAEMLGSEHNDVFNQDFTTQTNHSGGVQGGISNGQDIYFRVAFKPIASLSQPVEVIHHSGQVETLKIGGRHDVCVVPRAVPIVESMAALVILDHLLMHQAAQL